MGRLPALDALELSVPVARHMVGLLKGGQAGLRRMGRRGAQPAPGATSAREVLMDAGIDATIPAFSTVMACSTSMMGAIEAAGMIDGDSCNLALVGGVDSLSRVQIGLGQRLSDWLRKFQQARVARARSSTTLTHVQLNDIKPASSRPSPTAPRA